uniref:Protein-tyrosine sulfotransferase n=1 Tax=Alexandrium catenella TaxID=2925 RepID=A0A7S1WP86_ALECA|mmetsp:Transcript_78273/g.207742  ORF Transcript_78273/g.207742 Transcript_78273/m.207742 type:complete len:315 (+) Transcript_78273:105-1049(+)|eukprot:CAMPEP_0171224104 /NCGR_PEP_ID=MMETSP0790-20130122/36116_1 /TAXON_ID=2925 /ORGANISM="Alexandrium catenella, Strain OF101" /LENGTH=314 /DNA_ID=CAMNT_0011690089 /DNA_START=105 /DNA_END=1049 /DNA_ORIENTATION=-
MAFNVWYALLAFVPATALSEISLMQHLVPFRRAEVMHSVKQHTGKRAGFLLLAFQRTGTHWLTSALMQHSCIDVQPEVFYLEPDESSTMTWDSATRRAATELYFRDRDADAAELSDFSTSFRVYYNRSRSWLQNEGRAAIGFNLKVNEGFAEDWDIWLKSFATQTQLRIIWLQRQNILRSILSALILQETGVSSIPGDSEAVPEVMKLEVRPSYILYELQRITNETQHVEKRLAQANELGIPVLRMYYETLSAHIGPTALSLYSSSGCIDHTPTERGLTVSQKMHNASVREMVSNIEELETVLNGTDYEWMMSE